MKVKANPLSLEIEYAIRDVVVPASALEREGHRILKLNIGDPNKYDFDTPSFIKDSVAQALEKGLNGYAPSSGIPELMFAIVADERSRGNDIEVKDVTVTAGVTEALQMIFFSALSPRDEILVPGPSYPPYITYSKMIGANPVPYRTIEDDDWVPDIDDIRKKISKRTKAISIINPNNPTGAMYREKEIKQIGDIAAEHGGCFLLSDEIYNLMTFEGEAPSTAKLCPDLPVITMNGISKNYLAPGWRIGYLAIRDPSDQLTDIREGIERQARARLCANSICQYAFFKALTGPKDHVKVTNEKLRKRRDLSYKMINEIDGLSVRNPGGAFYMFPRIDCIKDGPWKGDREFVLDLLREEKVLTVFGSGFGAEYGSGHFRIVILPDEETLSNAIVGMERFIRKRIN